MYRLFLDGRHSYRGNAQPVSIGRQAIETGRPAARSRSVSRKAGPSSGRGDIEPLKVTKTRPCGPGPDRTGRPAALPAIPCGPLWRPGMDGVTLSFVAVEPRAGGVRERGSSIRLKRVRDRRFPVDH